MARLLFNIKVCSKTLYGLGRVAFSVLLILSSVAMASGYLGATSLEKSNYTQTYTCCWSSETCYLRQRVAMSLALLTAGWMMLSTDRKTQFSGGLIALGALLWMGFIRIVPALMQGGSFVPFYIGSQYGLVIRYLAVVGVTLLVLSNSKLPRKKAVGGREAAEAESE